MAKRSGSEVAHSMGKIRALILAGGRSSRMGRDKASLHYQGQRLIDVMVDLLGSFLGSRSLVLISGNVPGYQCILDELSEQGPIEGLRCALAEIEDGESLLVVPVDMPLLTKECLGQLEQGTTAKADFVRFIESELPCIFSVSPKLRAALSVLSEPGTEKGQRSFRQLFLQLQGKSLKCSSPKALCNANTPEHWEDVLNEAKT